MTPREQELIAWRWRLKKLEDQVEHVKGIIMEIEKDAV
jgi:hypothetical protein